MTVRHICRQLGAFGGRGIQSQAKQRPRPDRLSCLVNSFSSCLGQTGIPAVTSSHYPMVASAYSASTAANYIGSIEPRSMVNGNANEDILCLLQRILNFIDLKKVEQIMHKHQEFKSLSSTEIMKTWRFLEQNGITTDCVRRIPWLLTMDTGTMEDSAKTLMCELKIHEFRTAVPFLQLLPSRRLSRIAYSWNQEILQLDNLSFLNPDIKRKVFANRIEILSYWLNCESYEVSEMMRRTPVLMSTPLLSLEAKIITMLDGGVPASDIIRDPFIFTNMVPTIESKLALCKRNGLTIIKPWMLRCTPQAFNAYVQRMREEQQLLLGHNDIASFLSDSLKCTRNAATGILLRVPSVRSASAIKLNEMIQFLFAQGFTKDHILEVPRVLGHSVETVEKRISELGSHGFTPNSLFILCYTSNHYNAFLMRIRLDSVEEDV